MSNPPPLPAHLCRPMADGSGAAGPGYPDLVHARDPGPLYGGHDQDHRVDLCPGRPLDPLCPVLVGTDAVAACSDRIGCGPGIVAGDAWADAAEEYPRSGVPPLTLSSGGAGPHARAGCARVGRLCRRDGEIGDTRICHGQRHGSLRNRGGGRSSEPGAAIPGLDIGRGRRSCLSCSYTSAPDSRRSVSPTGRRMGASSTHFSSCACS